MFWKKLTPPPSPISNQTLLDAIHSIVATLETLTEQNKIKWEWWATRGSKFEVNFGKLYLEVHISQKYNNSAFIDDYDLVIEVNSKNLDSRIERRFHSVKFKKLYEMTQEQVKNNDNIREETRNAEFLNVLTEILTKIINTK